MAKKFLSISSFFLAFFFLRTAFAQELSQPPAEVKNVQAIAGNASVTITWDSATDTDGIVMGYKVYYGTSSVQDEDVSYDDEIVLENVNEYTITNLVNGVKYFIAVTALDDEENESETYSEEVSAVPQSPVESSPKVLSVNQFSNIEIMVSMSEPISIENEQDAFIVEEKESGQEITPTGVALDDTKISAYLLFPDGMLQDGKIYKITATSLVEDVEGNPVASGITDSIEFTFHYVEPQVITVPEEIESSISPDNFEEKAPPVVETPVEQEELYSAPPVMDEIAPLDATELHIDSTQLENEGIVILSWEPSLNIDNDVADQVLYSRKGLGAWDSGYSLGTNINELELEVDVNENYELKLVTVDRAGNASNGLTIAFSTYLAQSGPAQWGALIALIIAFFGGLIILGKRRSAY